MKKLFCAAACFCGLTMICTGNTLDPYKTNPWNLLKDKKYADAEAVFNARIVDPACDKTLKVQAFHGIFGAYMTQKKQDAALAAFDKYLADPQLAEYKATFLEFKGRIYIAKGKVAEALVPLKEAAALTEGTAEQASPIRLAFTCAGINYKLLPEVSKLVDSVLANTNLHTNQLLLISASETCWRLNRPADGMRIARMAEQNMKTPDSNVYRVLGYHLRSQNEFEEAEKMFTKAIELSKSEADKATLYRNIGENWERAEEYEKAIPYFQKAADCPVKGWWTKSAADSVKRLQKKIANGE